MVIFQEQGKNCKKKFYFIFFWSRISSIDRTKLINIEHLNWQQIFDSTRYIRRCISLNERKKFILIDGTFSDTYIRMYMYFYTAALINRKNFNHA